MKKAYYEIFNLEKFYIRKLFCLLLIERSIKHCQLSVTIVNNQKLKNQISQIVIKNQIF